MKPPASRYPDRGFLLDWRPHRRTVERLAQIDAILEEYRDVLPLTLRQLFYILIGNQQIEKSENAYRRLGYVLRRARRARKVPFDAITDDGSVLPPSLTGYDDPDDLRWLTRFQVQEFDLDPQLGQHRRLVLWCEASGIVRQLARVAQPYGVHVIIGGGFDSVTDKHGFPKLVERCGERFEVLHIGDYDRAGEDIFTVLSEDAGAFARDLGADIVWTRLAVTEEQVETYALPAAPIEMTGGRLVVQAEALPPRVLARLVRRAIVERLDLATMRAVKRKTREIRRQAEQDLRDAGWWED